MPLQNFVAKLGPPIAAAWLNLVDKLLNYVNPAGATPTGAEVINALQGSAQVTFTLSQIGGTMTQTQFNNLLNTPATPNNATANSFLIASTPYVRTAAEIAASVVPTSFIYQELNVLRYGADPTGVADSTGAFNQAVSVAVQRAKWALHAGLTFNCKIYVPQGWYLVGTSGAISYGAAPVLWVGDGPQASMIINGSTNQPAITVNSGSGQFYGGFDGLGFGQASGVTAVAGNCAISITNYTEFFMRNLGIYNFPNPLFEGLFLQNAQQYKVSDCEIQGCLSNNVHIKTGGYAMWSNVQSDDGAVSGTGASWLFDNAVKMYMVNCGTFGGFSDGWSLNSTAPSSSPNLNNEFVNCLGDTSAGHNWNIGDAVFCTFTNCWGSTQKVSGSGGPPTKCGFFINSANVHDCVFTACAATNNNQDGFQLSGAVSKVSFYNCMAGQSGLGNGIGTGGGYGFNVSSTANSIRLIGGQTQSNITGQINFNGNNRYGNDVIVRDILGFVSCNHNTGSITVGNTSVAITHNLGSATPLSPDNVLITPTSSPSGSGIATWWVSNFTTTTFTVNSNVAVATTNWTFDWRATLNEN